MLPRPRGRGELPGGSAAPVIPSRVGPSVIEVTAAPRWRDLAAAGRTRLTLALVLVELVAGIQSLVVTTVMPRVLQDLGGVEFYGLVFSGYLLSGLVSIPLAGRAADRRGMSRPFLSMALLFAAATLVAGLAPSMLTLAAARLVQGYGGGAMYALAYGVVSRRYPAALRARMLALLSGVWVVSGLVGPAYGALLASTVGWRWSFVGVVPLIALATLLLRPGLRGMTGDATVPPLSPRWPLLLAVAVGTALVGLSAAGAMGVALGVAGVAGASVALRRVLPPLRGHTGAALVLSFLLNICAFTADAFLPLLLTGVRGRTVAEAGIVVTVGSVTWFPGSWWQSRVAHRISARRLTALGTAFVLVGVAGVSSLLVGAPLAVVYPMWALQGVGMGIAFNTVMLVSMAADAGAAQNTALSGRFVMGRLGIIAGTGAGGVAIAAAHALGSPLSHGLAVVFGLALAMGVTALAVSRRL